MNILLVYPGRIPDTAYNDAERVIWWLGKRLALAGHEVSYLVRKGARCPFAKVFVYDEKKPLSLQIPEATDIVHCHFQPTEPLERPYLVTCYEYLPLTRTIDPMTVFVSAHQSAFHGAATYVHHGVDFSEYGASDVNARRMYYHFMGNAEWSGKNVRGAIELASRAGSRLHVIGGTRVNFRKGLRITLSPNVRFHGFLNPDGRNAILQLSRGLLLPAIRHEAFCLAAVESLYFGCPVFGTPYGALPELLRKETGGPPKPAIAGGAIEAVYSDFGMLSVKKSEILEAMQHSDDWKHADMRAYAEAHFSADQMAAAYVGLYEKVLNGERVQTFSGERMEVGEKALPLEE